ncbi:MAG: DUF3048 domain-containing protein [Candidatus Limnocylindrales bacterium]
MIEHYWAGHRSAVITVSAIAVVAIAAAGLLTVVRPGGTAQPSATPGATESAIASPSMSGSLTPLPEPSATPAGSATPADLAYSDLDGVLTSADLAHRLPIAIMVDDNVVARPQSGFSSASIVYQAPADGGEDRYMMVFQEGTATDIGPVRSARPYFVYWAAESKALFGHYGGDTKSLRQVIPANANNIYNMDDLNGGSCPYHRIASRAAPHNAYTNSTVLITCAAKRHYPATYQNLPVRTFRDDSPLSQRPATQSISVAYPTGAVGYKFDPATDSYLRSVRGKLQIDAANGQQVKARNVIVMFQAVTIDPQSEPGHHRPVVANVGTGTAVVFLEGRATVGTWKKTSNTALTRFYDQSGKEIQLVRGEIFTQSVPIGTALTYK